MSDGVNTGSLLETGFIYFITRFLSSFVELSITEPQMHNLMHFYNAIYKTKEKNRIFQNVNDAMFEELQFEDEK